MPSAAGAANFNLLTLGAVLGVLLVGTARGSAAEVYDSGWAVATPDQPSVLGPSGIRIDRVLPKKVLENLQLPAPEKPAELKWRPIRTAQRPGAASTPKVYPPLPLEPGKSLDDAFNSPDAAITPIAPETQALPEEPPRLAPPAKPEQHSPAPFDPEAAKPLKQTPAPLAAEPVEPKPLKVAQEPAKEEPQAAPAKPAPAEASKPEAAEPKAEQRQQAEAEPAADPDEETDKVVIEDKPKDPPTKAEPTKKKPAAQPNSKNFVSPKEVEKPARELPPLTRNQQYLRRKLRSVLSYYYRRPLNSVDHDAWEVMHSMLSYGLYSRVQDGGRRGRPVTAVGYLCFNKPCDRHQMFYITPEGNLDVRVGVGLQGHKGQLLSMLAQCNVSPDYPIKVNGQDFSIRDLIASEQLTCYERSELSFKLIGLMHYLPSDSTWVNDQGETWDFPKLIADERTQKIRGAACGGTHRLAGLTLAYKKRRARGEAVDGEWLEAENFTNQYKAYAYRLQNRDGSLSTEWFRGPGAEDSIDRRIRTTGHTLEWLLYAADDEELTDSRIVNAVNYLTNLITSNTDNGWEIGPLAHALHALLVYDQRMFQPYDDPQHARIAGRSNSKPVQLNYTQLNSGISISYATIQERHEERVAHENSGLGGLFGFGKPANRRSR